MAVEIDRYRALPSRLRRCIHFLIALITPAVSATLLSPVRNCGVRL
jgi:hypothetical protein